MFGCQARLPADIMYGTDEPKECTHANYASKLRETLEGAYDQMRKQAGEKQQCQKTFYDRKIHGK